uniref:Uncharacterized protein n=1 Tax=Hyaloperonospora arabidopsidis (strain Emoy2) TaxID=559515 RepID=M4BXG2_HYAAE
MTASSKNFDHKAHAQHRWQRFWDHDSKGYAGFSFMAGGLQLAKVITSHKKAGITFLAKRATAALPALVGYPLVIGIAGAELLVWGSSYFNASKNEGTSRITRDAKLAPAAFAVYGTTLNVVYPLAGHFRRVRSWFRPVKWGALGLVLNHAISKVSAISQDKEPIQHKVEQK